MNAVRVYVFLMLHSDPRETPEMVFATEYYNILFSLGWPIYERLAVSVNMFLCEDFPRKKHRLIRRS